MAKQPKYKRTLGKDGKPKYFELKKDSRGIVRYVPIPDKKGVKKFVDSNYEELKKGKRRESLSEKERKSLERKQTQKELWRIKGKPVKRWKTDLLEFTNMIDPKSPTREMTELPSPYVRPSDVDKEVTQLIKSIPVISMETEIGAEGFRSREEATGIHDVIEKLDFVGTDGWKLAITTEDGEVLRGNTALNYMKDWEIAKTEELSAENKNVAMVRFKYSLEYNQKNKTIYIDLNDVDPQEIESEPIKRTK